MENKNKNAGKTAKEKVAKKTNEVGKKTAEARKEWSKEWGIEKQTEGLDKTQGEAGRAEKEEE